MDNFSTQLQSSFMSLRSSVLLYSRNRPNECQCHRIEVKNCQDDERKKRDDYFERDIDDIADSVMQVMRICGLHSWDVKHTRELIKRSFRHYDEIRYRIDRVPRKRFAKENFIYDLAREAGMSRIDCQVAYSIVKRAFKAYYHGTALEGRRLRTLADNMRHRQECLWLHAAKRTAEIYAAYTGLMYSEQQLFEERIECVYKCLHEVLKSRELWDDDLQCLCNKKPMASVLSIQTHDTDANTVSTTEVEILFKKQSVGSSGGESLVSIRLEQITRRADSENHGSHGSHSILNKPSKRASDHHSLKRSISDALRSSCSSTHLRHSSKKKGRSTFSFTTNLSRMSVTSKSHIAKCTCPHLQCEREFEREAPVITAECSQGPYICRWLPFDREENEFKEHRVPFPPLETICPRCPLDNLPCDSECTCTCDLCKCKPAFDADGEEEHQGEKLSGSGLEDYDTDYCWLAPFRDWPRRDSLLQKEANEEKEPSASALLDEDKPFDCQCNCDYRQRAFPHLFTYLAPFRPQKPRDKVEVPPEIPVEEEEAEDLMNKRPPPGISLATYRCWNQPPPPPMSSSSSSKDEPIILVLPNDQKQPKVQGISMDVTVKKQHQDDNPKPKAPNRPSKSGSQKRGGSLTVPPPKPNTSTAPPASAPVQPREATLTKDEILDIIGLRSN